MIWSKTRPDLHCHRVMRNASGVSKVLTEVLLEVLPEGRKLVKDKIWSALARNHY